jgi:hypothetical protein
MLIDSSLAHGLAKRSHRELLGQSVRVVQRMQRERKARSTMPQTRKGARRFLRDFLELAKQSAIYVLETETRREGPACRYLDLRASREDQQMALVLGTFAPLSPVIEEGEEELAVFSRHALARSHQRCNEVYWEQLRPHVAETVHALWLMNEAARALNLKQGFLSTPHGMFVGDYAPDGVLHLKTFIRLDDTLAHGRWPQLQALMRGLVAKFQPSRAQLLQALVTGESPALAEARAWLIQKLALKQYQWLGEAYAERPDPVGELWQQAKAAAEAQLAACDPSLVGREAAVA